MIKGSGSINTQVAEAYNGKVGGKTIKNGSLNQSKYVSNMNQSQSPSQTFFKGNTLNQLSVDNGDQKNNSSFIGKKVLPPFKNQKKLYVSPYS